MANHVWSAEIETRTTFRPNKWTQQPGVAEAANEDDDVDVKSKERRLFLIKINGLNQVEQNATFKVKTSLNK